MIIKELSIKGCFTIDLEPKEDTRGVFARAWCKQTFEQQGLIGAFLQCNISLTRKRGTLRGLHYQIAPYQEAKLIRCTRGSVYDVILDLRQNSVTYKQWVATVLRQEEYKLLYVAEGVAHGFQTLQDDSEVMYPVSQVHMYSHERGVRWNDPAFRIQWPVTDSVNLSEKDKAWPDYKA